MKKTKPTKTFGPAVKGTWTVYLTPEDRRMVEADTAAGAAAKCGRAMRDCWRIDAPRREPTGEKGGEP